MSTPRTYIVQFWDERGGTFEIQAKSKAGAERIAKRMVDDRDFDDYNVDWCHGDSGMISVEPEEGGAA